MKLSLSMSMLDPFLSVERHSLHLCAIHLGIFCPILDWGAHSWQEMKARICPIISCCVFEITKQLKSNIKIWLNIGHSLHLLQLKSSMFRSLENLLRNFLVFLCSDLNLKENQKISWNYVFSTFPHLMKLKTKNVASTRSFCFSGISWINKTHIKYCTALTWFKTLPALFWKMDFWHSLLETDYQLIFRLSTGIVCT